jgi:hypothetical protein
VGPLGSAKTTFLKLLSCLCRRSVLVGDIRPAALYQLVHNSDITLLIDELELDCSRSSSEIARLLRIGNMRGVHTVRNGQRFSTFCFKVLTSRIPPMDGALASRALFVSMRPTTKSLRVLDEAARRQIIREFQPRLLGFRCDNLLRVRQYQSPQEYLYELTPRMKQLAVALLAPLRDDPQRQSWLITTLRDRDSDSRVALSLEPEWLAVEALFRTCHEGYRGNPRVSNLLVGELALEIRDILKTRGEEASFGARKAGAVLQALGIKTRKLGNRGRGLVLNLPFQRKIHHLAREFGIDRRVLASTQGDRSWVFRSEMSSLRGIRPIGRSTLLGC